MLIVDFELNVAKWRPIYTESLSREGGDTGRSHERVKMLNRKLGGHSHTHTHGHWSVHLPVHLRGCVVRRSGHDNFGRRIIRLLGIHFKERKRQQSNRSDYVQSLVPSKHCSPEM